MLPQSLELVGPTHRRRAGNSGAVWPADLGGRRK